MASSELQQEDESLKQQVAEGKASLVDCHETIAKLAQDVATLQEAVKNLLSQHGGGVSVPKDQGLLFGQLNTPVEAPNIATELAEADDGTDTKAAPQARAAKKGSPRTPCKIDTASLPSEDRLHDVPESQRVDPTTGKPLVKIGEKVFEELDHQRAQLRVIRHRQPIYGLPPEEQKQRDVAPVMADLPPRPLEKCAASVNLLAHLLTQKFANHLPLYR